MFASIRHSLRLFTIVWTLARAGATLPLEAAGFPLLAALAEWFAAPGQRRKREGVRLREAMERLGPAFIKLGQTLSTRVDLVGAEVAEDLASLQDSVPPFPGKLAREQVEAGLQAPLDHFFRTFDDQAVAAASIAQVHRAVTTDGALVAVKVLRPQVAKRFGRDLKLFFWLAEKLEHWQPGLRRLRLVEVVLFFERGMAIEMNLQLEAAAIGELRDTIRDSGFTLPEVDWTRTGHSVLTMQWMDGIPMGDIAAIEAAGHDRPRLARNLVEHFLRQALHNGFFHADMHPGNLMVGADGSIIALDCGIMGRMTLETRRHLVEIIRGLLNRDYLHVAKVHFDAGYVPANQDLHGFAQALRSFSEPIVNQPLQSISVGRLLAQLFSITRTFHMQTQIQLLLLQKSLVLVEGLARNLDPQINMWEISEPLVREWMHAQFGRKEFTRRQLLEGWEAIRTLPRLVRETEAIVATLAAGRLPFSPQTLYPHERQQRHLMRHYWLMGWMAVGCLLYLAWKVS